MSLFGRKFDYRGESHVEPCSLCWSRDQKGGGQVDQTTRRYDGGGWGERGGETWFSELLVAVAGVSFFLLRGFSAPATTPWLGCWFLVEELKIYILNIMEALFFSILAARLPEMLTRTSSWEPTTVPNLFCFSNTEKTYWRDIFREKISPYT